jgi:hypothetical protein
MHDKEAVVRREESTLRRVRAEVRTLRDRITSSSVPSTGALERHLDELETTIVVLQTQLEDLRAAPGNTWEGLLGPFHRSVDRVRQEVARIDGQLAS